MITVLKLFSSPRVLKRYIMRVRRLCLATSAKDLMNICSNITHSPLTIVIFTEKFKSEKRISKEIQNLKKLFYTCSL
jgi:hypothetical protein